MCKRFVHMLALVTLLFSQASSAENLAEIYQLAIDNDPQIKGAESQLDAAQAGLSQSRANFLPSLNLTASNSETTRDTQRSDYSTTGKSDFTNTQYSLNLNLPLFRYGNYASNDQASAQLQMGEAQFQAAQQALMVRVAQSYFSALAAQDNLEFAKAETKAISRQLTQTKQRFKVGQIAITGVHEAQARFDLSTAQQIAAENSLATAKEALHEIINRYPGALNRLKTDTPLLSPEPNDIEAWSKTASEQNLAIIVANKAVEAAYAGVKQARAGHLPNIDLFASHKYSDSDAPSFGQESTDSTVGIQLSMNLFQGGAISAAGRVAKARHRAASYDLEQQKRATARVTRSAYLGVMANISRVKALKQAVLSTQSAFDAVEAGYKAGSRTTVDVLNAQRELFRAKRDYAQARYDYILNTLQLKQAAGTLQNSDIEQVNNWLK